MDAKSPAQPESPVSKPDVAQSPGQPVKSKPKLSKWIIAATAVLVLAAVTGTAVYLLKNNFTPKTKNTQTTVESTEVPASTAWKTYTNTKYNYSIAYPDDWLLSESDSKNGVSFFPPDKSDNPDAGNSITLSVYQKLGGDYKDYTFEEYAKIAGKEIENYNDLASLKKITTAGGTIGYETTWMVQPMTIMGRSPEGGESESSPITYFEVPGDKNSLLHISLGKDEELNTYEQMLITLKFTTPPSELQPTSAPISTSIPIPTVDEVSLLKTAVKEASIAKHGGNGRSLEITVSKIEGNYAKGGVSDQDSGGMWFSAKVKGIWKLIWSGNGMIPCSDFTSYPDFPASMLPECWNEAIQDTVKR